VAERKPFLIRVDPELLEALERWAKDELRSLNGQIEFLLREAASKSKRLKEKPKGPRPAS
jgi:hypothetical protein